MKFPDKAVFLDRDGTINPDSGFISHPDDFNIYPYAAEAIRLLNEHGFYTFIVTNQSGIARGLLGYEDLNSIHTKMLNQLAEQNAYLDDIFVAPYYDKGIVKPYNINHPDRKPGLGMFSQAMKKYNFIVGKSYMIGDRYTDIVFGRKAGLKTMLVLSGEGREEFMERRNNREYQPDFIAADLLAAVKFITL